MSYLLVKINPNLNVDNKTRKRYFVPLNFFKHAVSQKWTKKVRRNLRRHIHNVYQKLIKERRQFVKAIFFR